MKRYEKPKCTHAFILHSFPMIKSLDLVSIWSFDEFPNLYLRFFTIQTNQSLNHGFFYHQNLIRNPWVNTQDSGVKLTLYNEMLSQLQNQIIRESILSYGSQWFLFELIYLDSTFCERWISSWFTYVHKGILVIIQGCTRINGQHLWTRLID